MPLSVTTANPFAQPHWSSPRVTPPASLKRTNIRLVADLELPKLTELYLGLVHHTGRKDATL